MIGLDQCILRNPATSPYNPFTMASDIFHPSFKKPIYLSSFASGKTFFRKLMRRLKIQSVRSVPPIPTMIIVTPNVQLSIFILIYLLMMYGKVFIHMGRPFCLRGD